MFSTFRTQRKHSSPPPLTSTGRLSIVCVILKILESALKSPYPEIVGFVQTVQTGSLWVYTYLFQICLWFLFHVAYDGFVTLVILSYFVLLFSLLVFLYHYDYFLRRTVRSPEAAAMIGFIPFSRDFVLVINMIISGWPTALLAAIQLLPRIVVGVLNIRTVYHFIRFLAGVVISFLMLSLTALTDSLRLTSQTPVPESLVDVLGESAPLLIRICLAIAHHMSQVSPTPAAKDWYKKLARYIKAFNSVGQLHEVATDISDDVSSWFSLSSVEAATPVEGNLSPAVRQLLEQEIVPTSEPRTEQAGLSGLCSHMFSKHSVLGAGPVLKACGLGKVHAITAATGVGKSTKLPVSCSRNGKDTIAICIPTIAAARGARAGILAMYGITPYLRAGGETEKGNCEIYIYTTRAFVMSMFFNEHRFEHIQTFLFDEMHVRSADNFLLRSLSHSWKATKLMMWASATYTQSFTLLSDLQHKLVEVKDTAFNIRDIFSTRNKNQYLNSTSMAGRYLFFLASTHECERFAKNFNPSDTDIFVITSKTLSREWPKAEKILQNPKKKLTVVIATNCLETGVTPHIDHVVDFQQKMEPQLTLDPPALHLKKVYIDEGESTQRKGRAARLFNGVYYHPGKAQPKTEGVVDSDLSLATLYAIVFGIDLPPKGQCLGFTKERVTDTFFYNCVASQLDPICVLGMTDANGFFFAPFKNFSFPTGVNASGLKYNKHSIPLPMWHSWHTYAVRPWSYVGADGKKRSGDTLQAPFFDYSSEQQTQVENWHSKITVDDTLSGQYDPVIIGKQTPVYDLVNACRERQPQDSNSKYASRRSTYARCPVHEEQWETRGDKAQVYRDIVRCDRCVEKVWSEAFPPTLPDADDDEMYTWYDMLFISLAYIVVLGFALYLLKKICRPVVLAPTCCSRQTESAPDYLVPTKPNRKPRVYERSLEKRGSKGKVKVNDVYADLDDFDIVTFWDDHGVERRAAMKEFDDFMAREEDKAWRSFQDQDTADFDLTLTGDWAEEVEETSKRYADYLQDHGPVHRLRFTDKSGREFDDEVTVGTRKSRRVFESLLPTRTPKYSLSSVSSSLCTVKNLDSSTTIAWAIIYGGFLLLNQHVYSSTDLEVKTLSGVRVDLTESFRVGFYGDLCILKLRSGVSPNHQRFSLRPPVPGERVALVRASVTSAHSLELLPSEISYCGSSTDGLLSYLISTVEGDCGTPVVAVRDGALVGIHSHGGSARDGCNFFSPLVPIAITELTNRVPQSINRSIDNMVYTTELLTLGCSSPEPWCVEEYWSRVPTIVCPERQRTHPLSPPRLENNRLPRDYPHEHLPIIASMRKFFPMSTAYKLDPFSSQYFSNEVNVTLPELVDYLPTEKSDSAYFTDFFKNARVPDVLPPDVFLPVIRYYRQFCPWMFAPLPVPDVSEITYDLNMTKSAGARLPLQKRKLFEDLSRQQVGNLALECELHYRKSQSEFVPPLWQVNIKDELRGQDRVHAGKTRTFMSCPVETMMGTYRACASFNRAFVDQCLSFGSTIGIDKFSGGWDDLAHYLGTEGMVYFSGDGKRFDSSVSPPFHKFNAYLRKLSLPDSLHTVIDNLYRETVFTPLVILGGSVVLKKTSNPSGGPNTPYDNTIALNAVTVYALSRQFPLEDLMGYLQFGHIRFVNNGDDFLMSMSERLVETFSFEVFETDFKRLGFHYTFTIPTKKLTEVVYLSHRFHLISSGNSMRYFPVLSPHRIVATVLFCRKEDAVSTYARYSAAALHAIFFPRLYKVIERMMLDLRQQVGCSQPTVDLAFSRKFAFRTPGEVFSLYCTTRWGLQDKFNPLFVFSSSCRSHDNCVYAEDSSTVDQYGTCSQLVGCIRPCDQETGIWLQICHRVNRASTALNRVPHRPLLVQL